MMSAVRHIRADELTRLHDRAITEFGGLPGISDPERIEAVLTQAKHWAAYEAVEDLHALTAMYCLADMYLPTTIKEQLSTLPSCSDAVTAYGTAQHPISLKPSFRWPRVMSVLAH